MNKNNYAAIMAGGIGTRFWPISRSRYPKQFLDILHTGKTLLQSTYDRFKTFIPNENIYIVTSEEYIDIVKEQLPELPVENIVGEPERKNTAACIAYISLKLKMMNVNANLIVAPSDHLIEEGEAFSNTCKQALQFTEQHKAIVTLGIKPTYANTGYGYIEFAKTIQDKNIFKATRFTEKPNLETAISFFESGNYLWNAGIFIFKPSEMINAFIMHMPAMYDVFLCGASSFNTAKEKEAAKHIYKFCESVSIDYAIMEKANNMYVIPSSFKWNDLGTWNSAWENLSKDAKHNAVAGDNTLMVDANGCMVHSSDKKLVVVGGVDDLIIVNTHDAILVCKKENEQQIKEYLLKVKETKGEIYL